MNYRCRFVAVLGVSALVGGAVAAPASADPAAAPSCQGSGPHYSNADLDGDSNSDVVVGVPRAMAAGHYAAGVVDVHYGPEGGARALRVGETQFGEPAANFDNFGASSSFLTANSDQCTDLAIGAPRADDGRGTVTIAFGSDNGLSAAGAITLTGRTADEQFGSKVVANGSDLWISAPDRTVDGVTGAGAVDHYRVVNGVATLVQTLTENTPGIHGGAETNDNFGRELDAASDGTLIVGEPAEDVGTHAIDAGTVTVIEADPDTGLLTKSYTFSQNSPGVPGVAESGDHFGASVTSTAAIDRIVVGVPGEALGTLKGAGTVDSFYIVKGFAQDAVGLSQNSPGVPGVDAAGDHFGKQVVDVGGGMCVGVPDKDVSGYVNTGEVLCVSRSEDQLNQWEVQRLGTGTLGGHGHGSAQYGAYLSTLPFTDLASSADEDGHFGGENLVTAVPGVTIPNEVGAGQVRIESRTAYHDSAGPMAEESYGVPAFVVAQGPVQNLDD